MAKRKAVKPEISCRDCIHELACSMQCGGNVMAEGNAMRCACYEDVKGSAAYFIGFMDGKKAAAGGSHSPQREDV